ncbi:MAG TPA: hypothetical protein VD993_02460 [Chitinophagaceae bacterium]|nr:hypothetical protein [Chitinophagaceae bacterium]
MSVFEKYLNCAQYKWNWYVYTLAGSMLPVILRFFISLDCGIKMFDIKDFLFAGLAMNLSNLTLIGSDNLDAVTRERIAVVSGLLILFIAAFLGLLFYEEDPGIRKPFFWMKVLAAGFVAASVATSYRTNKYIFTNKNKL